MSNENYWANDWIGYSEQPQKMAVDDIIDALQHLPLEERDEDTMTAISKAINILEKVQNGDLILKTEAAAVIKDQMEELWSDRKDDLAYGEIEYAVWMGLSEIGPEHDRTI